jgi:hypothetical protein
MKLHVPNYHFTVALAPQIQAMRRYMLQRERIAHRDSLRLQLYGLDVIALGGSRVADADLLKVVQP